MHFIDVESTKEMHEYITDSIRIAKKGVITKATLIGDAHIEHIKKEPYLFMVAAVSDYVPKFTQIGKLKKNLLGESYLLEMKQNIDILSSLDKTGIKTVAFKAEMDEINAHKNALSLLEKKGADAVCLNILKDSSSFGSEDNEIEFISKNSSKKLPKEDKLSLSFKIVDSSKAL